MQLNVIHVFVLYVKCTYKYCLANLGKKINEQMFLFFKLNRIFCKMESLPINLSCLLQPWMSCHGVCEGILWNFIISTDDKLPCIYIKFYLKKKRGVLSWKPTCIQNFPLVDANGVRMSNESRLKVVQVNNNSSNVQVKMAEIWRQWYNSPSIVFCQMYVLVAVFVYFFQF